MSPQEKLKLSVPSGKLTIFIYYTNAFLCVFRPACWDVDMLVKMLDAGMNCARLNFSQGDHKGHSQSLDNLREALAQRPNLTCAVMLDTKGPEIRTGYLKTREPVEILAN